MLLTSIAINGGIMVMFGLGGNLFGEHDLRGLTYLYRKIIFSVAVFFMLFIATVLLWPDWLIVLFQNGKMAVPENCGAQIAIFCSMFLPFSMVMVTAALYQVLEYRGIGIALTLGLFIGMILCVWGLSLVSADVMWWGFPVGSGAVFLIQFLYCLKIRACDQNRCFFTLIPQKFEGKMLDLSIEYTNDSLVEALTALDTFLKTTDFPPKLIFRLHLTAEELMQNLVKHAANSQTMRCFDLQITVSAEKATMLLKDDGGPFNPVEKTGTGNSDPLSGNGLGLTLLRGMAPNLIYKYMYGQNTVFVSFLRREFQSAGN